MRRTWTVVAAILLAVGAWWGVRAVLRVSGGDVGDAAGLDTGPEDGLAVGDDGVLEAAHHVAQRLGPDEYVAEGRIQVGAVWRVRVLAEDDGTPVASADVEAEFDLGPPGSRLSLSRNATTFADGVALLRKMPRDRVGVVGVSARGFVGRRVEVPVDAALERAIEVRLERALPDEASVATIVADVLGGRDAPDPATVQFALEEPASGRRTTLVSGGAWWISNERRGPSTVQVRVRPIAAGWIGDPVDLTLARGTTTRVPVELPPPAELRVRVHDADGRPVEGAVVEATAPEIDPRARPLGGVRATSDPDGLVSLRVRRGLVLAVRVQHDLAVDPEPVHAVETLTDVVGLEVTLWRVARLVVELDGADDVAAGAPATMRWSSAGASAGAPSFPPPARREPGVAREAAPPGRSAVHVEPDGRRVLELRVAPRAWSLEVFVGDRASAATSVVVPTEGARLLVTLVRAAPWAVRVVAGDGAEARPLPGALVVARALDFDARSTLLRAVALAPGATAAPTADADDRWALAVERQLRAAFGDVGLDVGATDGLGVARPLVTGPPSAATVLASDGSVAALAAPFEIGADGVAVLRVGSTAWSGVRVEVLDDAGRPRPRARLLVNPTATAASGRRELTLVRDAGEDGAFFVGALPGESFALLDAAGGRLTASATGLVSAQPRPSPGGTFEYIEVRRIGDGPAVVTVRPAR